MESSRPILPPEVIDLIIDKLHDQPHTLRACSLISHYWLPRSRHHLFRRMCLDACNIGVCRGLLKSPHNTFSFHLRGLHVTAVVQPTQLLRLMQGLPRLHSLDIYGIPVRYDTEIAGSAKFPLIRSLTLSRATFASYTELSYFLSRFPALKKLALERISFDHQGNQMPDAMNLDLDALKIAWAPELIAWLQWTGFSLRARSIELNFGDPRSSHGLEIPVLTEAGLSEYFDALGTHLERLRLKFANPSELAIFSEHPRLVQNTRLRWLRIGQAFWIRSETDVRISPSLARLLKQLESSGVEELIFDASVAASPGQNLFHDYPPLPQDVALILDGADFARVRRVSFFGPWDRSDDILRKQFQSAVLALLPVRGAQGMVHIHAHPSE
ncbi:hypothetical protein K438DRAFT_1830085 [Mycena galopus ATCC 62051]|nr:hypothetical protein K438DRAFT_1830085 [Mycena galopus ATCC 62051]